VVIPEGQRRAGGYEAYQVGITVASVLAFLLFACVDSTGPVNPGNQANGRITIVNDPATLGSQVTYFNDSIPVDASGVGYLPAPARSPGMSASLVSPAASGGPST